ncbi:Metallo-peptidase family M12-domain-containing protein [Truncatella angustata]|uniref:Disintegrin and metalloproteinase domain-containing protein B n=1 Tax=Truncatella angustata TaxID=152316 RepID=A0A9P8UQ78_9PEZI|nr:Metallo-peptidase family M12-domain-containing protein [Truncatella angustata]KAH6656306.1 Metallo-peptidase family M12-domain-containing protein [Truncatella angustata]
MRGILSTFAAVLSLWSHSSEAHSTKRNALNYISRVDDPILHTPSHRVHAHSSFELTFLLHAGNDKVRLTLQPNYDVLSDDATVQYLDADGNVQHVEPIRRSDHRVFKGDAFVKHPGHGEWLKAGWARISVYRDGARPIFEGAFRIDGNNHHVQTSTNYRSTQHHEDPAIDLADDEYMVVWRDSDVLPHDDVHGELKRSVEGSTCESDSLEFNNDLDHPIYSGLDIRDISPADGSHLFSRQDDTPTGGTGGGVNLASTIGSTAGCPTSRKVALVGIATDCTYTALFDSKEAARTSIIQMVSAASEVYESTFNVSLGIHDLVVSDASCPGTAPETTPWNVACGGSVDISSRLNLFSNWRAQRNNSNAYWTLLSTCNTDSAVGLAWLGQLCVTGTSGDSNQTVSGANVVVRTSTEWQVFAHESGHTFGAVHDCISSTCSDGSVSMQKCCPLSTSTCNAGGDFIMNPSTGNSITQFSACSIGNICSALGRNSVRSQCLTNNKDVVTISEAQCGNGIVEQGEECDCGGTQGCGDNSCCDASTCQFKTGAVCDPSNEDCCSSQCQYKSATEVCRASTGACDPQETCSGTSAVCPADKLADDGTTCGSSGGGLTCASGQCTSRDLQCKTVVGAVTTDNNTAACNSQSCQLTCSSSRLGPNTCYNMNQYFLDGTPCAGGGKCDNGECKGGNFATEVGSWISDNKNIVIPVASVVGGLFLLSILCCCWNRCGKRRPKKPTNQPLPPPGWHGGAAWNAPPRPPPAMTSANGSRNRLSRAAPPSYAPYQGPPQQGIGRVQTARYA